MSVIPLKRYWRTLAIIRFAGEEGGQGHTLDVSIIWCWDPRCLVGSWLELASLLISQLQALAAMYKLSEKPWEDRLMAVGKNWSCPIVMERGGLEIAAYFCELRDNARKLAWGISPKLLQMPTPWAFSAAAPLAASRICVKELHSGQSHLTHYAIVLEAAMQEWQQGLQKE